MLSADLYWVLGAVALGVLWLNTMLISSAAWVQRRRLGAEAARWAVDLRAGRVSRGAGAGGVLAKRIVRQTGRALTISGPDRIVFGDGESTVQCLGGEVDLEGRAALRLDPEGPLELWLPDQSPVNRADTDFDAAFKRASTNKGMETTAEVSLTEGKDVWVAGPDASPMIAAMNPIGFLAQKRRQLALFAIAAPIGCALVTAVAVWPPVFGLISSVGGALCLAFFLAIQPLGTALRDMARLPPGRAIGGTWQRDQSPAPSSSRPSF